MVRALLFLCFAMASQSFCSDAFREVSFTTPDGGEIYANLYGQGGHAVALAHGAVFDKESWHSLALELSERGLQVLAIDFRGYGKSRPGKRKEDRHLDLLGAVDFLKGRGSGEISFLGGSMGGAAAAKAAAILGENELSKLVLLAPAGVASPKKLAGDKLFIVSEGDRLRARVETAFGEARQPKALEIIEGDAHAQHIFKTRQGPELTRMIVDFLGGD